MLRELHVSGCPPLEMEAAIVNAGLRPWDDLLLAPEPRGAATRGARTNTAGRMIRS